MLALFAQARPGDTCFEWFRMTSDHLTAAMNSASMDDEIASVKARLEIENEYLREAVKLWFSSTFIPIWSKMGGTLNATFPQSQRPWSCHAS